jgi:GAF domain-containing protein
MHHIEISGNQDKSSGYEALLPQIDALVEGEADLTANLANIAAALKTACGYLWVGFYLVKGEELVLGPFQGPVACTRIGFGRGVCGTAWEKGEVIVVPDVEQFPGHIACSSASKSEIVLPVIKDGQVIMVLDVDSDKQDDFDQLDAEFLQGVVELVEGICQFRDAPQTANGPKGAGQ